MKLTNWTRFTWDLTKLPRPESGLPEHYEIAAARPEDEKELRKVISSSFLLDPAWNPAIHDVMETIDSWLQRAFESETSACLALRHGTRIIGAAVVSLDPQAEHHLAPGPCIMMEYRNRGFGTCLLGNSLSTLQNAGFVQAVAIAKENVPVTKFVYTKFNSVHSPHDFTPLLAA